MNVHECQFYGFSHLALCKPHAAEERSEHPNLKRGGRESRNSPGLDFFPLYFFVQLIAGTQSLLHWGAVVRGVEVEELHACPLQPPQGLFQLRSHALGLQRVPFPRVGLGGDFHWQRENEQR